MSFQFEYSSHASVVGTLTPSLVALKYLWVICVSETTRTKLASHQCGILGGCSLQYYLKHLEILMTYIQQKIYRAIFELFLPLYKLKTNKLSQQAIITKHIIKQNNHLNYKRKQQQQFRLDSFKEKKNTLQLGRFDSLACLLK